MGLPIIAQGVDGASERLVRITEVYRRFVLRAICMHCITMAEPMRIVEPNDAPPLPCMVDLELNRILDNSPAPSPVRAAEPDFVGHNVNKPRAISRVGIRHEYAPSVHVDCNDGVQVDNPLHTTPTAGGPQEVQ